MDPTIWPEVLQALPTIVAIAALWVSIAQGRKRERDHLDRRLSAMAADITQVKTDVAQIFGRFEGQRDVHIAQGLPNYRTTEERH